MTESGNRPRIIRFGAFEFDTGTGELRKHGLRIRLKGQPIAVLTMLLERSGEIVTREELQKRLWPADTYVDFELGLNAAIKRLRAALGDSADSPRFVETLARQGYRFVAPTSAPVATQPAGSAVAIEVPPLEAQFGERPTESAQATGRVHLGRWMILAAAVAL